MLGVAAALISAGRRLSGRGLRNCLVGLRKIVISELSDFLTAAASFSAVEILSRPNFSEIRVVSLLLVLRRSLIFSLKIVILIVCHFFAPFD